MRTAAEWATIRQGVLGAVPAAGSIEDRARSCLLKEFVWIVQRDVIDAAGSTPALEEVLAAVRTELTSSMARFKPFNSAHEGYAVILEELDELWDEVKVNQSKRDYAKMEKECIQVAAMAVRLILDVVNDPKRGHEKVQALYDGKPSTTRPSDATLSGDQPRGPSAEPTTMMATKPFTKDDPPPAPAGAYYDLVDGLWVLKPTQAKGARNLGMATYRERPTGFVHGGKCAYRQNTGDCDCAFSTEAADAPNPSSAVCAECGRPGGLTKFHGKWSHLGLCHVHAVPMNRPRNADDMGMPPL